MNFSIESTFYLSKLPIFVLPDQTREGHQEEGGFGRGQEARRGSSTGRGRGSG